MKFVHLSDLHIGKRVNEYSMLEDQRFILSQILDKIEEQAADAVIIAGDVYDKAMPPAEAVQLFDNFLTKLEGKSLPVFVISGNHDSPERIAFGGRVMSHRGIHMSPVYRGEVEAISLEDEYGEINVYMLPFIKPAHVRACCEKKLGSDEELEIEIKSYTDAMRVAIDEMKIDKSKRNILITHQFVTGADRTESENISVGGTDNVDVEVFKDFDYVALGHIHRAQKCSYEKVRYSGTPLKYSFSEAKDIKTMTVVEIKEKGELLLDFVELKPLRDMVELKGKYKDLMSKEFYENTTYAEDYVHITLTDEEDEPDAIGKLRQVYHNLMKLDYDNTRTRNSMQLDESFNSDEKTPLELFEDFFEAQNGRELHEEERDFMKAMIERVWEG